MVDKKKLNNEQLEAVKYKSGPLLIIAGAGTGKTTVITERVKYLIEKKLAKPSEILALTFTEKASSEMQERIDIALPLGYTQMWISTFHAFCDRVLRDSALNIGLDPKYKLNTQAESIQFFRKNLFEFDLEYFRPLGNPTKFIDGMIQHFSRLQDEDVTPNEYLVWVNSKFQIPNSKLGADEKMEIQKWKELANAYKLYDELKTKAGVMDFGDVIVKTLELFRRRPNVLKEYQNRFKYILVDEFQDTNISQNEMVKLLAGKATSDPVADLEKSLTRKERSPTSVGNITVVLDDDQSIYHFRGAAVSNALYFRKFFPKLKVITLIKNYRSSQNILDKAYDLIQFNNPDRLEVIEKIDKKLVSQVHYEDTEIKLIHKDRVENEAEAVINEITSLVSNNSHYNYKDVAILVRANGHADPFVRALSRHGIPHQFLGPGRLFKQPEIIDLISYLKVLYDFDDSVSMYKVLSMESFDISPRDLIKITNYAKQKNLSLFETCSTFTGDVVEPKKMKLPDLTIGVSSPLASERNPSEAKFLRLHPQPHDRDISRRRINISEDSQAKIGKIMGIIFTQQKNINKETAGQHLYNFLSETGLILKLLSPDNPLAERRAKNIAKFFDKLRTYEIEHEDSTVRAVVDWIDLASELGESPLAADTDWTDINAVNILTVHSSKGLEFPVVFLVNLVSQRFPTTERHEQIPIPEDLIKEVLPKGDYHVQEERRLFYVGMTRAKNRLYLTAANFYGEGKREKKLSNFIFEALGEGAVGSEPFDDAQGRQLSFLDYRPASINTPITDHQPPIQVDFLSYSQIETFKICPLHYKLKYIYKLTTPPSSSQSFGNTFHATMKDFYDLIKKGEKPSIDLIYKILAEKWIPDGYKSKSHEQKSFEKAKKFLKHYFENLFDPKILPIQTEQPFIIRLGAPSHKASEGRAELKVGGKIDRVDNDGSGIHIIDYKTGANPLTQKEADKDLQLSIYALAASEIPEYPFNRKPSEIKLSLYYFDDPQTITTVRSKVQLEEAKKTILDYKKQIEESDFKCSHGYLCDEVECEYKMFCRVDEK